MSARRDPMDDWPRTHTPMLETLAVKVVALVLTSALAILLWQFALVSIGHGASLLSARETAAAVVVQCPRGLGSLTDDAAADEAGQAGEAGDGCIVRFTDTSARLRTATLEHPGLFSLDPGDEITVVIRDGGAVGMAGWQPLADAGLLLLLAVGVSGNAVGWWRRVLEHPNPRYDGGDPLDDATQSRSGTDQDRKDPRDL